MLNAASSTARSTRRALPAWLTAAALAGLLAAPAAQAAGKVEVSYTTPEKFTDIGWGSVTRDRNLDSLTTVFETLGRFLPDGQTLRVEVLDVDLAGEPRPGTVHEVRVVRGGVDWPQITLRYTLLDDGKAVKSAEERVRDANYMTSRRGLTTIGSNLPYEKRMVENWFRAQFLQAQ
jgi:hypothetical protein